MASLRLSSDMGVDHTTEIKSSDQRFEERTGVPSRSGNKNLDRQLTDRETATHNEQRRERNVEDQEREALREGDEKVQASINENILDRTRGLQKTGAGQGVARAPEHFLQSHDQKQLAGGFTSHVLGSDYNEHTENLSRGRSHSYAPIPLPPTNQYNMFPQNQNPVDMSVQLHVGTLERMKWQPGYNNFDPMMIQPDPSRQPLEMFNIPDIQRRVNPGVELAEQVGATPEFSEIIHPLNKRFTASDDPYLQNGKNFRQAMGFDQGDAKLTSEHIAGRKDIPTGDQSYWTDAPQRSNEDRRLQEGNDRARADIANAAHDEAKRHPADSG